MTAFLKKSLLFIYSSHFNRAFYIFKTPPKFFKLEKQKNTKKKVGVVSSSPNKPRLVVSCVTHMCVWQHVCADTFCACKHCMCSVLSCKYTCMRVCTATCEWCVRVHTCSMCKHAHGYNVHTHMPYVGV